MPDGETIEIPIDHHWMCIKCRNGYNSYGEAKDCETNPQKCGLIEGWATYMHKKWGRRIME